MKEFFKKFKKQIEKKKVKRCCGFRQFLRYVRNDFVNTIESSPKKYSRRKMRGTYKLLYLYLKNAYYGNIMENCFLALRIMQKKKIK